MDNIISINLKLRWNGQISFLKNLTFLYSRFLLVIDFIHISVYMYLPILPTATTTPTPAFPPCCPYVCSLHLCLCFSLANQFICTIFSRFHIYVLICDICFSLSDLLHSVWQSLGPSTSLQMTQFCSFLWPSNIPLYIWANFLENLTS